MDNMIIEENEGIEEIKKLQRELNLSNRLTVLEKLHKVGEISDETYLKELWDARVKLRRWS